MKSIPFILVLTLISAKSVYADVLFSENFDTLPDWQTESKDKVGPYPNPFDYGYTSDTWHPTEVAGSKASMSISGSNPDQVFGGSGKAFVATYESYSSTGIYTSDGFLLKDVPPSNELYVSFKMKFQPGWNAEQGNGSIKLFRIVSYDGTGSRSKFFSDGNSAPMYFFDWQRSDFGVRQKHSFRCDAQGSNYFCTNPSISGAPRSISSGDMSANFSNDSAALSPQLTNLVSGGFLPSSGQIEHDEVYGDVWHTLEFYVKLNSSPSIKNGELKFWLDGEPLIDMRQIPWIDNNGSMNAKWNGVAFGGNGKYHYDASPGFSSNKERWVAFDDIVVLDGMPNRPNAPIGITVQ